MRKTLLFFVLLLVSSMVFAVTDEQVTNYPNKNIPVQEANSGVKFTGEMAGIFTNLDGQPSLLSFSTLPTDSLKCQYALKQSTIFKVNTGGIDADSGLPLEAGSFCNPGSYIRYYICQDKLGDSCKDLFQELWFKSDSNDLMKYGDYDDPKKLPDFYSYYTCYNCNVHTPSVTSYSCFNNKYRGEPGTSYANVAGGSCVYGCKKSQSTIKTKNSNEIVKEMCADKKVVPPTPPVIPPKPTPTPTPTPSPKLSGKYTEISVPTKPSIKVGEKYKVEAIFVADTAGDYYLEAGTLKDPLTLAVVDATKSQCNTDKHWAGQTVSLKAKEAVTMSYTMTARDKPGTFPLVVGAYTGCCSTSSCPELVSSKTVNVKFVDKSGGNGGDLFNPIMIVPIVVALVGIGLALAGMPFVGVTLVAGGVISLLLIV